MYKSTTLILIALLLNIPMILAICPEGVYPCNEKVNIQNPAAITSSIIIDVSNETVNASDIWISQNPVGLFDNVSQLYSYMIPYSGATSNVNLNGMSIDNASRLNATNITANKGIFGNITADKGTFKYLNVTSGDIYSDSDIELYPNGQSTQYLRIKKDSSSILLQPVGSYGFVMTNDLNISAGNDICITGGNCLSSGRFTTDQNVELNKSGQPTSSNMTLNSTSNKYINVAGSSVSNLFFKSDTSSINLWFTNVSNGNLMSWVITPSQTITTVSQGEYRVNKAGSGAIIFSHQSGGDVQFATNGGNVSFFELIPFASKVTSYIRSGGNLEFASIGSIGSPPFYTYTPKWNIDANQDDMYFKNASGNTVMTLHQNGTLCLVNNCYD